MITFKHFLNKLDESAKSTTFEEILSSIDCSENIKTLLVKFCRNEHIKPSDVEEFCGYDTLEKYFKYALTHYVNLMYIESELLSMSLPPLWDNDFEKNPKNIKAFVRKFNSSKVGDPIASWYDSEFVFKASDSTILGNYAKEVDFQEVAKYGYSSLDGKNAGRGSQEEKDKYNKFYMKSIYPKLDKLKLK